MDTTKTNSIRVCLGKLSTRALSAFQREIWRIYSSAEHPAFITVNLFEKAMRAAETNAQQFLADAVLDVSKISIAPEAYAELDQAVNSHLSNLEGVVVEGNGVSLSPEMFKVFDEKLAKVRDGVIRSLENHRASFSGSKSKGGAREGYDWDGAKAHVMRKYPKGLPKSGVTQSDVAKAMAEWFSENYGDEPGKTRLNDHAKILLNNRK